MVDSSLPPRNPCHISLAAAMGVLRESTEGCSGSVELHAVPNNIAPQESALSKLGTCNGLKYKPSMLCQLLQFLLAG